MANLSETFATTQATVSIERVLDLLVGAFEGGGSTHWVKSVDEGREPTTPAPKVGDERYYHWSQWNPVFGGSVIIIDIEGEPHELDRARLESGLRLMAEKGPGHYADLLTGNEDADTGDAFLQYCVWGEIAFW